MKLQEGDLTSEVVGTIGKDGKVLIIQKVDVTYRIRASEEHRETIERVHDFHADFCPVARSIAGCIEIETRFELVTKQAD